MTTPLLIVIQTNLVMLYILLVYTNSNPMCHSNSIYDTLNYCLLSNTARISSIHKLLSKWIGYKSESCCDNNSLCTASMAMGKVNVLCTQVMI